MENRRTICFKGWDFSHLKNRWESERLPWDYKEIVLSFLNKTDHLLDMGTGGGEFLLSLNHPYELTSVTESYQPNIELCKKRLAPLGITVTGITEDHDLPFKDNRFDIIINRHDSFDMSEVKRILKKGGFFITQQVGGRNNYELSQQLCIDFVPQFLHHTLQNNMKLIENVGFEMLKAEESFTPIRFYDVGALVYFAKIIPWEFPNFTVESALDSLLQLQKDIDEKGFIQGTEHRFIIVARKIQ